MKSVAIFMCLFAATSAISCNTCMELSWGDLNATELGLPTAVDDMGTSCSTLRLISFWLFFITDFPKSFKCRNINPFSCMQRPDRCWMWSRRNVLQRNPYPDVSAKLNKRRFGAAGYPFLWKWWNTALQQDTRKLKRIFHVTFTSRCLTLRNTYHIILNVVPPQYQWNYTCCWREQYCPRLHHGDYIHC